MPIEHDNAQNLPPLKSQRPPLIPVEALVAIAQVRLAAGDVPPGILRQFYERVLSLRFISGDGDGLLFSHARRQILLERGRSQTGQVALLIRSFDAAVLKLRDASVPFEVLHTDAGMTRTAVFRDPAGNWVQLVETRDF